MISCIFVVYFFAPDIDPFIHQTSVVNPHKKSQFVEKVFIIISGYISVVHRGKKGNTTLPSAGGFNLFSDVSSQTGGGGVQ